MHTGSIFEKKKKEREIYRMENLKRGIRNQLYKNKVDKRERKDRI
jgi:hypothetical protein